MSNWSPSTTSSVVSVPFASSTEITPSPPTFSTAPATISPMAGSLWAEMVATCTRSRWEATERDWARSAATAALSPRSMPRLRSMALAPAATLRTPSANMAWASSVAVVVPSPTASPVRSAAWRIMRTPRSSSGSESSSSLAMVTPSLHTSGRSQRRPMRTHFDFGPSVTRTASARAVAPRSTASRAWASKSRCLAVMRPPLPARPRRAPWPSPRARRACGPRARSPTVRGTTRPPPAPPRASR